MIEGPSAGGIDPCDTVECYGGRPEFWGTEFWGTSPAKGLKNKGFLGPCPLDRDVAALYGVETRIINQAVKNNPGKFPAGYVVELTQEEIKVLRSKILTLETNPG